MRTSTRCLLYARYLMFFLVLHPLLGVGADNAGLNHECRTFHSSGKIDQGKFGDSCTTDLVMYLAGNNFMVM